MKDGQERIILKHIFVGAVQHKLQISYDFLGERMNDIWDQIEKRNSVQYHVLSDVATYAIDELEQRRELAKDLLRFPEGSFAHAFLEAYVRADTANVRLMSPLFDYFAVKFEWKAKYATLTRH